MGLFSYTCAKTHLPLLVDREATILFPNGDKMSGRYDGYGNLAGLELQDYIQAIGPAAQSVIIFKIVLKEFYEGESFDDIAGSTHHDPGQGFFYGAGLEKAMFEHGAFASLEEREAWCDAYLDHRPDGEENR